MMLHIVPKNNIYNQYGKGNNLSASEGHEIIPCLGQVKKTKNKPEILFF